METLRPINGRLSSDYTHYTPNGKSTATTGSTNTLRVKSKEMDRIIDELDQIHPEDDRVVELGREFMKLWVENMFSIITISFKNFTTVDQYYWTGFPTNENPFVQPLYWFGGDVSLFRTWHPRREIHLSNKKKETAHESSAKLFFAQTFPMAHHHPHRSNSNIYSPQASSN